MADKLKELEEDLKNNPITQEARDKHNQSIADEKEKREKERLNSNYRFCGLRQRQINATWEVYQEKNSKVKVIADIIRDVNTVKWFVLCGETGIGKTFLMSLLAKDKIKAGKKVVYGTSKDLLDTLNCTEWERKEEERSKLRQADVLIIDEINRNTNTAAFQSEIFSIINCRYDEYLQTVIISNLKYEELFGNNGQIFDTAFQRRFEEMGIIADMDEVK